MEEIDITNQLSCGATCGTESTHELVKQMNISFDNIDITTFPFSLSYKCAKSTTGQVVQGLQHMALQFMGEKEYKDNKKEIKNDYQKYLYPKIATLAIKVVEEYRKYFVEGIEDPLRKQVFGANLNGNRNDGQLNKFIPCRGVDKNLRYKYAQFGQLLSLLMYRLTFIINRNPDNVKRYRENNDEKQHFIELKNRVSKFCRFLKNSEKSIFNQWEACLTEAHKLHKIEKKLPTSKSF